MINENLYDKNGGLIFTHVGQIIHSTTLDTEEKVKAIYGGIRWKKIEGRFLLGQSSSYNINSTGGEETHKLTIKEMPEHDHLQTIEVSGYSGWDEKDMGYMQYNSFVNPGRKKGFIGWSNARTKMEGKTQPHNNMPPYKVVYIWERIK